MTLIFSTEDYPAPENVQDLPDIWRAYAKGLQEKALDPDSPDRVVMIAMSQLILSLVYQLEGLITVKQ